MLALGALALGIGCNDNDDNTSGVASVPGPDMGTAATARVRVAHLSPDAPAVDVCLAPHGSGTVTGPLLGNAGVATGISYSQVTSYQNLPAGQYDVRVVAAGATTCSAGVFDATDLPPIPAGATVTIAAIGFLRPPPGNGNGFRLQAYVDDANANAGTVGLRFIHASPDTPPVDVGLGSGATFSAVFVNVSFSQVGRATAPPSDANGYVQIPPPAQPPTLSARLHGASSDALTITLATAPPAGTLATVFAIGNATGTPQPLKALVCVDNAPTQGPLSVCSILP